MRFVVHHETLYRYSTAVRLAPHVLRLTPRPENVRVDSHALTIEPLPETRGEALDAFGNVLTLVSFSGTSQILRITSHIELETLAASPVSPAWAGPPLPWQPSAFDDLGAYRDGGADSADDSVRTFAWATAADGGFDPVPFLERLNAALHARIEHGIRWTGDAQRPAVTLATGRGACRDMTALFMAACRSLGIPARFVSGYHGRGATPDARRHLHAWPEVFLPGRGWRGWDPTQGVAVGDDHVSLCAAPEQSATMPVEGGFFANGVTATLDYDVRVTTG
jgi:transglutaminase-like putative cysteine protease